MSRIIDQTTPGTPETSNPVAVVRSRQTDWASTVAAIEGQTKRVSDYVFSNKTFTRIDRLLNPKTS